VGLSEVFKPGQGICLDVGCGDGRHRSDIELAGFKWVGLDFRYVRQLSVAANALRLPFANGTCSAVVSWQSLEHFPQPWTAVGEMQRVLQPGGQLFGSTSFLEPFHDHSYLGFSELGLRQILTDTGFEDINIQPGISSFPLIGWTLFSRIAGGRFAEIAFDLIGWAVSAANAVYPAFHRAYFALAGGPPPPLEESYWFGRAPREFAGHLIFMARKPV
jgi:SAM-dependent methyltransferase